MAQEDQTHYLPIKCCEIEFCETENGYYFPRMTQPITPTAASTKHPLTDTQMKVVRRINQLFKHFNELRVDDLLADDYLEALSPDEIREAVTTCPLIKLGNNGYILYCHDISEDTGQHLPTEANSI